MNKEKFNWKGLFIQETEKPEPVAERNVTTETRTTFPQAGSAQETIPNEVLSKVIEMYEKGFDSLNQSGYDFYEFFKAVMATDPNNSQSYLMAYTMASSMDKAITKTSLLSSGDFYMKEVMMVYSKYDNEGKKIKSDLVDKQRNDKDNLQAEIKTIQNKILVLQSELEQKSKLLKNYDTDNTGKVYEIEQKILANNLAKDRIVQKISQVISGITNHI